MQARLVPIILILFILVLLLSLGFWQLDRADQKKAIEDIIIKAQKEPLTIVGNIDELLKKEHYQVLLEGHYDSNKQFIYDNQIVKGNAGYYVLTPFLLNNTGNAILINRGFVSWDNKRSQIIDINISNAATTIKVGLIKPVKRIELKEDNLNTQFPVLIQALALDKLRALTGYYIIPMLGRLDKEADNGFFRKWQPFYNSVDRHLGYAWQWFLMAFALFIILIYLLIRQKKHQ